MELQKWKKKKDKAENDGDLNQLFFACKALAEIYFREERFDAALKEYKEMERVSDANNNRMDVARCNRMIGEVYCEKGEFSKAIKHQITHLNIAQEEKDKVEEQRALATLGRTYFLQAESETEKTANSTNSLNLAKQYYKQSLSVCEHLSDDFVGFKQKMEMRSRLFLNLGLLFDCQNQFKSAEDYLCKSVLICKKIDLWDDLFRTYTSLGSLYQKHKNLTQALSTFDLALQVAERLTTKQQSICDVLLLKSEALLDQPNFRGARQALLRAYKIHSPREAVRLDIERKLRLVAAMCETEDKLMDLSPESDFDIRKQLYEDLGDMCAELGNFSLSLTYYHLMLECVEKSCGDKKSLIDSYLSLAQTYKDNKQYDKSVEYFKKELILEKDNPYEACKTSMNIAELYQLLGKEDLMIDMYKRAKSYAEIAKQDKLLVSVLFYMQKALFEMGNFACAEDVQKELQIISNGNPEEPSEEESEEPSKEFGLHICLEDLSEAELSDNEQNDKRKLTRTRVKCKSNLERRNEKGETPLHLAAISGNANHAKKLIEQGHRVDIKDYSGWTPLHEACNHGNRDVAEVLLKSGATINDRGGPHCDGVTPLLDAASNGNFDCIELLLEHGASPLMRTNAGDSVLDCLYGWRERRLAECGDDLDNARLARYSYLFQKLQQTLEKAGQKTNTKDFKTLEKVQSRNKSPKHDVGVHQVRANKNSKKNEMIDHIQSLRYSNESAANEYECAMKALRYKNKPDLISPMAVTKTAVPALLNSSETVGDDWLDDDMNISRPNKKRRTGEFIGECLRRTNSHLSTSSNNLRSISPPTPLENEGSPSFPRETECDLEDCASETNQGENESSNDSLGQPSTTENNFPSTSGIFSNKLKGMNASRKTQITLIAAGVSREKSVKLNTSEYISPPREHVQSTKATTCLKVKVEAKLLLIPIPSSPEELNIAWLAQEAANRYRSLEGVEPILRLSTQDGACLVDTDPLSLVIELGDLVGNVQSWKLPPLTTIYEEACAHSNINPNKQVFTVLEACQATGKVSLEDLYLDSKQMGPIFKALSHFHTLQSLDMSGNDISDCNIKEISECLVKFTQLRVLDLSNTNITSESLAIFAQVVQEIRGLQRLQSLNLGYNPLKDCIRPLAELLNTIPALTCLKLESIGLSPKSFRTLQHYSLDCLEVLNVNHNQIGDEGIIDLLGRLDSRSIVELRLSGTSDNTIREVGMYLQHNAPPLLTTLDVSYCKATDIELHELIKGINMCPRLEAFLIDGLTGLTSSSAIDPLINKGSLRELSICGLQASQVFQIQDHMENLSISSCVNQPWARRGPFGFYTNERDTTTH